MKIVASPLRPTALQRFGAAIAQRLGTDNRVALAALSFAFALSGTVFALLTLVTPGLALVDKLVDASVLGAMVLFLLIAFVLPLGEATLSSTPSP